MSYSSWNSRSRPTSCTRHPRAWLDLGGVPSCKPSKGGFSAGVAVLVRARVTSFSLKAEDTQKRQPCRFQAVAWPGVLPHGLLVGSFYCYDSGGPDASTKNVDLLAMVAREAVAWRLPFVIAGAANSGLHARARAMAVSAGRATYLPGAVATKLDYNLISVSLQATLLDVRGLDGAQVRCQSVCSSQARRGQIRCWSWHGRLDGWRLRR